MVGTFRDVTAEHYSVQRQTALARSMPTGTADTFDDALHAAIDQHARAVFGPRACWQPLFPAQHIRRDPNPDVPELISNADDVGWDDLRRDPERITRTGPQRRPADGPTPPSPDRQASRCSIRTERSGGVDRPRRAAALHRRGPDPADRARRPPRPRPAAGAPARPTTGNRAGAAARDPRPGRSAGRVRRALPARNPRPLQVGGDWYDVVALDDGRIALVVGDCVGHGLWPPPTVMGQLRSACRALLLERLSPADTLAGLDRFAARLPGAACTTAFCAVLDHRHR